MKNILFKENVKIITRLFLWSIIIFVILIAPYLWWIIIKNKQINNDELLYLAIFSLCFFMEIIFIKYTNDDTINGFIGIFIRIIRVILIIINIIAIVFLGSILDNRDVPTVLNTLFPSFIESMSSPSWACIVSLIILIIITLILFSSGKKPLYEEIYEEK